LAIQHEAVDLLKPKHQRASLAHTLHARRGHKQKSGPLPVVLVADGRSGSKPTMTALAKLTGSCLPQETESKDGSGCWPELFGGRALVALQVAKMAKPSQLVATYLKQATLVHHDSALVGFQWKTFKEKYHTTRTPEFKEAWDYLGDQHVRALYYTRNPLDEFLSTAKRAAHKELASNCAPDDDECMRRLSEPFHVNASSLPDFLSDYFLAQRAILNDMHTSNVKYLKVSYEELVDNPDAESRLHHWKRVMKFLNLHTVVNKQKVHKALDPSGTKPARRGAVVKNWAEVVHALKNRMGGQYAYLLTDRIEYLYGHTH